MGNLGGRRERPDPAFFAGRGKVDEIAGRRRDAQADLVIFDAPTPVDAVRTLAVRRAVVSRGKIVARTAPPRATVTVNGRESPVTFLRAP